MDSRSIQYPIRWPRALWTFAAAYAAVTVVATAFCLAAVAWLGDAPAGRPLDSPGYRFAERFLPILNLAVWTPFAALYFRGRARGLAARREGWALGALWLALALPVDYLGFVWLRTPVSLSAHDFYVGQFPWLYLIYAAVLASPLAALALRRK
ncbi:MAG TPA: hypothetical protein VMR31_19275 [Myxococcota bacterium]|nr:hypothetical protein [Myxococcota bacterium]